MTYFPHSDDDIKTMLKEIGLSSLEELAQPIPSTLRNHDFKLEPGNDELSAFNKFTDFAKKNRPYNSIFLGAGAYQHYIPAAVDELSSRQEFYTAYTPYQAEISQGTLQAIFEYQTYTTELTGMDVANASMYDGATAMVEAAFMAINFSRKKRLLVDRFVHPDYISVLRTYCQPLDIEVVVLQNDPYVFDDKLFYETWDDSFAAYLVASPNYFGSIIDYTAVVDRVHDTKGLVIQVVQEALSLALLRSPGESGADITCGEAMSFGVPLSYGGPYLGFLACTKKYMRKMPGRIVGLTTDRENKPVYVLTLTAREQHIRRELATSNICSNHNLCAIRACIYLSLLGETGLRECSLKNIEMKNKVRQLIDSIPGFSVVNEQVSFNEFIVTTDIPSEQIHSALENAGILSFKEMGKIYDGYNKHYLVTVTEMNTDKQIEQLINTLEELA
jgi:glycine dehydrogenase subunit 1